MTGDEGVHFGPVRLDTALRDWSDADARAAFAVRRSEQYPVAFGKRLGTCVFGRDENLVAVEARQGVAIMPEDGVKLRAAARYEQ